MTTKPRRLRHNFVLTLVGNVVYTACQWGLLLLLTKTGTAESVGWFVLGLSIAQPVTSLANLGLRQVYVTDVDDRFDFSDYLSMRVCTFALALVTIAVIVLGVGYRGVTAGVIIASGAMSAMQSLSDIYHGLFQRSERMDLMAYSLFAKGGLSLAAGAALLLLWGNVLVAIVSITVARLVTVVAYDIPMAARLRATVADDRTWTGNVPRFRPGAMAALASTGWPLGITMLVLALQSSIPRYFVEFYLTERDLGIFGAISFFMLASVMLATAMGQSVAPRLARHFATGDLVAFQRLLSRFVVLSLLMGLSGVVVAAAFGYWILLIFYTEQYAAHTGLFVLLMTAGAIQNVASALCYGMTAARRFRIQPVLFGGVTAVAAILSVLLIPRMQLHGAALAMIGSNAVWLVGALATVVVAVRVQRAAPAKRS